MRGAKMLATGGIMANEVFVTCIQPLQPGDETLRHLLRRSDERQGPEDPVAQILRGGGASAFRQSALQPLRRERRRALFRRRARCRGSGSSSTDDIAMCQKQFHATPAHVYQNYQCQIRLMVKLRFLTGWRSDRRGQRHRPLSRRCARRSANWRPKRPWSRRWSRHGGQGQRASARISCRTGTRSTPRRC